MSTNWLLLRGLTREQRHWEQFPATLAERLDAKVTCIDSPGFGTESARLCPRTIAAVTDDIRARFDNHCEHWSLLGISFGGMVALDWMARYPNDFQRGVVINSSSGASPFWHRVRPAGVPSLLLQRFRSDYAQERAVVEISSNSPHVDKTAIARRWADYLADRRPSHNSVVNQAIASSRFTLPDHVATPLLILSSRADRLVSFRASQTIAARLQAPIRLHDNAGHDLPLDDADWICDRISEWFSTSESEPSFH
ncbi:alpha/beta fold hydrolase [Antrihabitans sp. YC2-6]|uniref:alpha/beta fold hydrolase n=1 Tax=Antrihabitans sp. YC2-6 TaxID=2799498 RepID=UPI0018F62B7A|nr:alpha/beta fold hydrolase [Antrihabitans sp. YC2-6]MBJ8347094.1 alpha/beta fold hydrolase [Antrihabitans sp. YC2-6]